ncbi:hypothetical protein BDE36_4001 [Arcticibacter tournemirensis]|nr:hypothetical protein [Arcticibacter tournemirensis]TQM52198.1 hypothetical protein BDE36_4001 [Arcticibacter tournemirensis]
MVRYFTPLLIAYILITVSCGKTENPVPKKNIERILIAPEMIIQRKGVAFDVAVRYFKDYTDHDKVSLTLNGQTGALQSETSAELEGTTMVFRFQPVGQAGDFPLKVVIDNGQEVVEQQLALRFVNDFTLAGVWNSLQKDYLSTILFRVDRSNEGHVQVNTFRYAEPYTGFGLYFLTSRPALMVQQKPFINGLSGNYVLEFANGVLQNIKISHGEKIVDTDYNPATTRAEIASVDGVTLISEETVGNDKITTYRIQDFKLSLHETPQEVYTIVTRIPG